MPEVVERQNSLVVVEELEAKAEELVAAAQGIKIWLFSGEMGAGKTTFIKAICKKLGVTEPMHSPTFSIVNEYKTSAGDSIYHFDFYRLKSEEEAFDIGVEEYFESGKYCFVEWPEKFASLIPAPNFMVHIKVKSPTARIIEYAIHD